MEFNPQNFISNIPYMGKGMLGIFVTITIIIITTVVINKIFSSKKK